MNDENSEWRAELRDGSVIPVTLHSSPMLNTPRLMHHARVTLPDGTIEDRCDSLSPERAINWLAMSLFTRATFLPPGVESRAELAARVRYEALTETAKKCYDEIDRSHIYALRDEAVAAHISSVLTAAGVNASVGTGTSDGSIRVTVESKEAARRADVALRNTAIKAVVRIWYVDERNMEDVDTEFKRG